MAGADEPLYDCRVTVYEPRGGGGGGGSHIKVTGMLVVSLRGVNCRFLSHFGCF